MRIGFYPKLALDGITKNKSLYFPYILTSICMVMMEYIIMYLGNNEYIKSIPGGQMLSVFITLGIYVIGLFSILFLFYSNSFLMKKRKKEFGLYNILGMGKRHISLVILWENFILYLTSVVGGLVLGISFSKFAELCKECIAMRFSNTP